MPEIKSNVNWFTRGANILLVAVLKGMSHMPFRMMYGLSDFLAMILYRIVKYRKKVVYTNLRLSFPEKSEKEISGIMVRFYRFFADYMLETIKGYSIPGESLEKRITFLGIDKMNQFAEEGRNILLFGMHYGNTEWSSFAQPKMKHQYQVIYNPLQNPVFELFLQHIRERWGAKTIPVNKSARIALGFQSGSVPFCIVLAADQRPPSVTPFWTIFMNQEACFNSGVEKIARKTNLPIFFHVTRMVKRGYYEVSFIPLLENPKELTDQEILLTYVKIMEKYIREAPEYYLWSHRRWKQKRPEGYPLFQDDTGRITELAAAVISNQ